MPNKIINPVYDPASGQLVQGQAPTETFAQPNYTLGFAGGGEPSAFNAQYNPAIGKFESFRAGETYPMSPLGQVQQPIVPMPTAQGLTEMPVTEPQVKAQVQPTEIAAPTKEEKLREPAAIPTKEMKAIEKSGMKQAISGYEEGAYQAGRQKGMMDELQAQTKAFQEKQKANQEALAKAQVKMQEIESEASKLKPQDFWANQSTGSKIAAAIAMGVGAYSAAMTGGQNTAKQIIDSTIAQDLALQKEQYQRAKDRGALARNQYSDLVTRLGSEEAADATLIANAYKMIDTKLKIQESQAQNAERAMKIQQLRSEIDKTRVETQIKQLETFAKQEAVRGAGDSRGPVPQGTLSAKDEETYVRDPEFYGFAPTKEEAIEFRKTLPGYRSTMRDLERLFEISKQPGKSLNPTLKAEVTAISQRLIGGGLKDEILGPGTIQKEERALVLNDVLGDPTALMSLDASTKTRLKSLVESMQYRKGEQAKILGLQNKARPTTLSRITIQYQGQSGPITKDVTPEMAEVYERNAKAKNIPFKRLTP